MKPRCRELVASLSGTLLDADADLAVRGMSAGSQQASDVASYRAAFPGTRLRSAEECLYHRLLFESLRDPEPVLANVARWADRG